MKNDIFKRSFSYILWAILGVMAVIYITNTIAKNKDHMYVGFDYIYDISDDWVDNTGSPINFKTISDYDTDSNGYISAYYSIPQEIDETTSILYRSEECITKLLIDGELVYQTDIVDAPFYDKSPGTVWNVIHIDSENKGKVIELQIKPCYNDKLCHVDNIELGDRAKLIQNIFLQNRIQIILCLISFFMGVIFLGYSVIVRAYSLRRKNVNKQTARESDFGLRYLSVFAMIGAIFCLVETDVLQLLVNDISQVTVSGEMALIVGAIPLILFMDSCYGVLGNIVGKILLVVDCIYVLMAFVTHMTGILDFNMVIDGSVIIYLVIILYIFIFCIKSFAQKVNDKEFKTYYMLEHSATIILISGIVIDAVLYAMHETHDSAMFTRITLTVFLVLLGVANAFRAVKMVEYGMRNELVGKLAYKDGLTEVGNRTAYMERLDEITRLFSDKLGVILFDVNNLKQVNDNLGHAVGDNLICTCADIIYDTFNNYGDVYRIGGDEFVVLIPHENPQAIYDKHIVKFNYRLAAAQDELEDDYPVFMAQGFAYADEIDETKIKDAIALADNRMYENKKKIKEKNPVDMTRYRKDV